jgi:hypothetical protein
VDKTRLLDVVRLKAATTGPGEDDGADTTLEAGETGTIVFEFDTPDEAYLVEFSNEYGEAVAMFTSKAGEFDAVWRAGTPVSQRVGA